MKIVLQLIGLACFAILATNCKKQKINPVYYNVANDVIAPTISCNTLSEGDIRSHGVFVHIIGIVSDLEVVGKSGQLYSFNVLVNEMNAAGDTVLLNVINKSFPVDKKEASNYSVSFVAPLSGIHYYKAILTATDYASRVTKKEINFMVN